MAREMVSFTEHGIDSAERFSALVGLDRPNRRDDANGPGFAPALLRPRLNWARPSSHAAQAAEAIMTSDTRPKQIAIEFKLGRQGGAPSAACARGAGMIQPGMSGYGKTSSGVFPQGTACDDALLHHDGCGY